MINNIVVSAAATATAPIDTEECVINFLGPIQDGKFGPFRFIGLAGMSAPIIVDTKKIMNSEHFRKGISATVSTTMYLPKGGKVGEEKTIITAIQFPVSQGAFVTRDR